MPDFLLERAAELAAIDRAVRLAHAGSGRCLVFTGPPGSGRTALVRYACAVAAAHGLTVLSTAGDERERDYPFAVARRLLGPLTTFGRRYDALLALNRALAAYAPALVSIDDLDSCDAETLEWLAFAARRLSSAGIAIVAAGETSPFDDAIVFRLRPLSECAVRALLHVELGHNADRAFARACHHATGGHPLLVRELAAAARRGQRSAEAVPPGVVRFVERRLRPLARDAQTLAHAIALLGGGATLHRAAALAELAPDAAAAAADRLRAAGLLTGGEARVPAAGPHAGADVLAISPPLLARALYDRIPPARRALWHGRAAREAIGPTIAAKHLLHSQPTADPSVAKTLRRVAARKLERGRPDEAAEFLRRAVQEGVRDRGELLLALAGAERRLADPAEIVLLEEALELGAPHAATTSALTRALLTHGRTDEALALSDADPAELHAGARLIPGAGRVAAARLAAAIREPSARRLTAVDTGAAWLAGPTETPGAPPLAAVEVAAPGPATFRRHPGRARLAAVEDPVSPSPLVAKFATAGRQSPGLLACRAFEAVCAGTSAAAAVSLASQALDDDQLDPESPAYFSACAALVYSDRLALARSHLDRALVHARRLGSVCGLARAEAGYAALALRAGEPEEAVIHATTALDRGCELALTASPRVTLLVALLELDRPDDAAMHSDASTPALRYARGRLRLESGDAEAAVGDFVAVGRALKRDAIDNPALIPWRSAAALAGALNAEALARDEHALAVRWGAPRAIGRALRALAIVGAPGQCTERLNEAVATLAPSETRLEYAHALCDLGARLRRQRARRAAREPLLEALDLAVQCGAVALARRAGDELAATGARLRRLAQSGRDALTPAELRVAHLAARGLANREIARILVVTVKTVETELSHAYAKLGIRSRRDLTTALQT